MGFRHVNPVWILDSLPPRAMSLLLWLMVEEFDGGDVKEEDVD